MMDIRSIIKKDSASGKLRVVKKRVKPVLEAARLINDAEPAPVLLENVRGSRVLANVFPTRDDLARRLGVAPKRFLAELSAIVDGPARRGRRGIVRKEGCYGSVEVPRSEISRLPFLTYYRGDGGPYLTAGVWIVRDPRHGVNLSYHRLMMTGPREGTVRVVERRGTDTALKNSGGSLEAAICVGAPVNVLFAAALSPASGVNELDIAARFAQVELVRCKSVDLEVPASCEMVIEGRFTGETGPEGPFVDITGTMDIVRRQPVFEITRVACGKDPVHYTIVPGKMDHKTLMGVPKELDIFREAGKVCRCLDVRITPGGSSWLHAVVKIAKRSDRDGREALKAAFRAHRSLKHCVVVDEDVDIADPVEVEWALATRFQADRDMMVLTEQPGSSLDPSACHVEGKGSQGTKLGLDATIRTGADRSLFRKVPG
ncbi:MAG: UbiD family decarboxylase [Elusimicrobiota bacterium]